MLAVPLLCCLRCAAAAAVAPSARYRRTVAYTCCIAVVQGLQARDASNSMAPSCAI
jgi:hypothetical protein